MWHNDDGSTFAGVERTQAVEFDRTETGPAREPTSGQPGVLIHRLLRQQLFPSETDPVRIGRYVVLRLLGTGGMGQVFAGYDAVLDRKVAIKLLLGDISASPDHRTRLLREAQGLAKLSHPNVVQIYEAGEHEGQVFIAMEYVEGQTLTRWTSGDSTSSRPSARAILTMYLQAGQGLAAAHRAGLVHRDFKPANVIVDAQGCARVLDFGLVTGASASGSGHSAAELTLNQPLRALQVDLTATGAMLGTPAYMAPEQFTGGVVDARTDQFGFCVALYEALTGARPFAGDSLPQLIDNVTRGARASRSPRTLPRRIARALERGLAVEPEWRWPSMEALLDEIQPRARRRIGVFTALITLIGLGGWWLVDEYERRLDARADQHERELAERENQARNELVEHERERAKAHNRALIAAANRTPNNPHLGVELLREVDLSLEPDPSAWLKLAISRIDRTLRPRHVLSVGDRQVDCLRYSPDGRWLAACGADRKLEVWELGDHSAPRLEPVAVEQMLSFAFNPANPDQLAILLDGEIRIISLVAESAPRSIATGRASLDELRFDPSGTWLVAERRLPGSNKGLRLWPLAGGPFVDVATDELLVLSEYAFTPDGSRMAIAYERGRILLQAPDGSNRRVVDVNVDGERPTSYAFSPDGTRVAVVYDVWNETDDRVRIWELDRSRVVMMLDGRSAGMSSLVFSPDGRRLASWKGVWELETGDFRILNDFRYSDEVGVTPESDWVVTWKKDTLRFWSDQESAEPVELRAQRWALRSHGSQIAIADAGTIVVYDLDVGFNRRPRANLELGPPLARRLEVPFLQETAPVALDRSAKYLVSRVGGKSANVWLTRDWYVAAMYSSDPPGPGGGALAVAGPGVVAGGSSRGQVRLWTAGVRDGVLLGSHSGPVTRCDFNPDKTVLLTASRRGRDNVILWDPATRQHRRTLEIDGEVELSAFSPDGRSLALALTTATNGAQLQVWHSLDDERPLRLDGHDDEITALEFDPTGTQLLSASRDGTVRLWSVAAGTVVRSFDAFEQPVIAARFSPNGRSIVTASGKIARVWPIEGGEPLMLEHTNEVTDAVFAPDGGELLTGTRDGDAHRWTIGPRTPSSIAFGIAGAPGSVRVAYIEDSRDALVITGPAIWRWEADYSIEALLTWMWRSFPVCPSASWREHTLGLDSAAARTGSSRCEAMVECTATRDHADCRHLLVADPSR